MKNILCLILLLFTVKTFACSCSPLLPFQKKEDLKQYDLVALVSIKQVAPLDPRSGVFKLRTSGDILVDVLEVFKGSGTDSLYNSDYQNDCALNVDKGQQWLVFGYMQAGKMHISRCTYTSVYKDVQGLRDWRGFSGIHDLDLLRHLYEHNIYGNALTKTLFYPNGKPELIQKLKGEKLSGTRNIFYTSGAKWITETIKNGLRDGKRCIYDTAGHLVDITYYKKGLKTKRIIYQDTAEIAWYFNYQQHNNKDPLFGDHNHDSSFYARKLDSLRRSNKWNEAPQLTTVYFNDGRSYEECYYDHFGRIERYTYVDALHGKSESWQYNEGVLRDYTLLDQRNNKMVEYDYKPDGSRRDFINDCTYCKYYFPKEKKLAEPEPLYIQ